MELLNKLKNMNDLDITWNEEEDGTVGRSPPITRTPFKFQEQLMIVEGDDELYLRFSCDDNNHFWIPVGDQENFLHLYKIYTTKYNLDEKDQESSDEGMNSNEEISNEESSSEGEDNIEEELGEAVDLPYENTIYFYGGLCPNIEKLEAKMIFNKYLCNTRENFKTAFWLSEQPRQVSTYYTLFSRSVISFELLTKFSVQLDTKNDTNKFHPLFIKISYPSTVHTGIRYKIMGDCMLYDVLSNKMPYDIWAALQNENIFDEERIIEMISGMGDDLNNEKDYLNFVLAALKECINNPISK